MDKNYMLYKAIECVYGVDEKTLESNKYKTLKEVMSIKANEATNTGQSSYGAEFVVPTTLNSRVVERVREKKSLLTMIPQANQIIMQSTVYDLPVEGADSQFVLFPEGTAVPQTAIGNSKFNTGKVTLTAKKVGSKSYVSAEMFEDVVMNFMNYIENKIAKEYEVSVHNMIINGDVATGANTNINAIDGTPAGTENYLAFDGLVKKAFTNSCTVDVGTLALDDFRSVRKKLGLKGTEATELVCIMGSDVYFKTLNLTQVETIEKYGVTATVVNGKLTSVDGMEILIRKELGNGTSAGKVSTTPANNTLGRFVVAHTPSMYLGFKRLLTINSFYDVTVDQYVFVPTVRFAYNQVDNNGDYSSALGYNITL